VDDAIVVVENIVRHMRESGHDADVAAVTIRAVDEVGNPTILATLAVVAAFTASLVAGLMHVRRAPNLFHFLLVLGCLLLICVQAIINVGVVTAVFPTKGMSLPFISAGLSNLLLMGLLLGGAKALAAGIAEAQPVLRELKTRLLQAFLQLSGPPAQFGGGSLTIDTSTFPTQLEVKARVGIGGDSATTFQAAGLTQVTTVAAAPAASTATPRRRRT
jgi:hypothetical protein